MIAHINIGSNLGHRAELISRAVMLVEKKVGKVEAISEPVETRADGFDSMNMFLNVGINVETGLKPVEIVAALREIELALDPAGRHRNDCGGYCDRRIDLDLICMGSTISADPRAIVPHPRMARREFVLIPLNEILPDWTHPQLHLKPAEIFQRLTTLQQ